MQEVKRFYRIVWPLNEAPTSRFREFISINADNPAFLMQVDPTKAKVSFIPSLGSDGGVTIPINIFVSEKSTDELKGLSNFCSKFNMLASVASSPKATSKTHFIMKIKDGPTKQFPYSSARLILNLKVTDPVMQLLLDNLLRVFK